MATGLMTGSFSLPYQPLMVALYIFLLASYVGFYVISKVPPTLHTPLMSGSNAISGITIVGSLQQASQGRVVPDSFTHGSSEQRQTWFYNGYQTGDPDRCDTFSSGI